MKIALALAVLVAVVFAFVGRQGRLLAEAQAIAEAQAERPPGTPSAIPAARSPVGRAPSPSLAEAPIGRALPPPPLAPLPAPGRLGGPSPTSITAAAEQMGPPAPRLRLLPRPVALDSATFQIGSGRVRLVGVEALPTSETCGAANWPCGMQARTALRGWLRSRSISCSVPDDFGRRDQTISARCQLGQDDIALWLVENGWARAVDTSRYTGVEDEARKAGRGIWQEERPAAP